MRQGGKTQIAYRVHKDGKHAPFRTGRDWSKTCAYATNCSYNGERCEPNKGPCPAVHDPGEDTSNCGICQKRGEASSRLRKARA